MVVAALPILFPSSASRDPLAEVVEPRYIGKLRDYFQGEVVDS